MDSRRVSQVLRQRVRPLLAQVGFREFTSRGAWRHHEKRVETILFRSWNQYNADVMGITTYSFQVDVGSYLTCVPEDYEPSRMKVRGELKLPAPEECHFRGGLRRSFSQRECGHDHIWYVAPDGAYLDESVDDVAGQLETTVEPWFHAVRDDEQALHVLATHESSMPDLWGFGRLDSPMRDYILGYLLLDQERAHEARAKLTACVSKGSFTEVRARILRDAELAIQHAAPVDAPKTARG